ncbi:MAG TPA: CopG family transcriptional regulator [Thermoanaerobaculia bacterium]|jgi:Arc/MetJ family transcription regulator|nr:CopG family transcriptional regulator [Thermoanaerobaculia bacterium]
MRTTIRLDDHLLAEAKERAARQGVTLASIIEQALRETFSGVRNTLRSGLSSSRLGVMAGSDPGSTSTIQPRCST